MGHFIPNFLGCSPVVAPRECVLDAGVFGCWISDKEFSEHSGNCSLAGGQSPLNRSGAEDASPQLNSGPHSLLWDHIFQYFVCT